MPTAKLERSSYYPGESLVLEVAFDHDFENPPSNVSIDVFQLTGKRLRLAYGFGLAGSATPRTVIVEHSIPASVGRGIYAIGSSVVQFGVEQRVVRFNPVYFAITTAIELPLSSADVEGEAMRLEAEAAKFVDTQITTAQATADPSKATRYRTFVFAVGCLLRSGQQLAGYRIDPLSSGLSLVSMQETVNGFLQNAAGYTIDVNAEVSGRFASDTPLIAVSYANLAAVSHDDAVNHCRNHSNGVFSILGVDRGQRPRAYCYVAENMETREVRSAYEFPGYRGNLVSGFDPSETANRIEHYLPKLETNPWLRLLVRLYADGTAEDIPEFRLLRFWNVLELVAKKVVADDGIPLTHPDGSPIVDGGGRQRKTNSALGKVYHFVESGLTFNASYTTGGGALRPWEVLEACYAIRNSVAHEGRFDPLAAAGGPPREQLAANLWNQAGLLHPVNFCRDFALRTVWNQA